MSTRITPTTNYTFERTRGESPTPVRTSLIRQGEELRNRIRRFFRPQGTPFSFFDEPFLDELLNQPLALFPSMDVAESENEFVITAELPGMKPKDVHVEFENGILTIRGEKLDEHKEGDGDRRYHLYERGYGAFNRALTLPSDVDGTQITAEFADGVLTIRLPKTIDSKSRRREIEILEKK